MYVAISVILFTEVYIVEQFFNFVLRFDLLLRVVSFGTFHLVTFGLFARRGVRLCKEM